MSNNKIALTASMRSNLLSLKNTQKLFDKTQDRLSSGYKVNSAMDNPSSYFTAQALNSRANQYIASLRVYGRVLTAAERTANYQVDKARFLAPAPRDVSPYTAVLTATTLFVR